MILADAIERFSGFPSQRRPSLKKLYRHPQRGTSVMESTDLPAVWTEQETDRFTDRVESLSAPIIREILQEYREALQCATLMVRLVVILDEDCM